MKLPHQNKPPESHTFVNVPPEVSEAYTTLARHLISRYRFVLGQFAGPPEKLAEVGSDAMILEYTAGFLTGPGGLTLAADIITAMKAVLKEEKK